MKFERLLHKLSTKSNHHQHRLACIIAKGNKILSVGFNQNKTHTKSPCRYKTLHAEIAALIRADRQDLRGTTAYVYRSTRNGQLANSKPCKACMEALVKAGIKHIVYTQTNSWNELYV